MPFFHWFTRGLQVMPCHALRLFRITWSAILSRLSACLGAASLVQAVAARLDSWNLGSSSWISPYPTMSPCARVTPVRIRSFSSSLFRVDIVNTLTNRYTLGPAKHNALSRLLAKSRNDIPHLRHQLRKPERLAHHVIDTTLQRHLDLLGSCIGGHCDNGDVTDQFA